MNSNTKLKVLYIAKNIPTPKKKTNRVIFDIALNLSSFCDIKFLFPKEIVPFWLRKNPRFAYLYKLQEWVFEGFKITPIPYVKLPFKHFQYWSLFYLPSSIKKYIKKNTPSLVHAHYLFPDGYMAYKIFKKFNIPYVLTFRNQDRQYLEIISENNQDYKKAERIINNAKTVLTPNGGYKEFVESRFNVACKIMPHGIEQSVFSESPQNNIKNEITTLSVADGLPTKNVDWVIKAFNAYKGEKQIQLLLVGDVCNQNKIRLLAQNNKQIQLLGKIPRKQVLELMRESDIFALPSSKETFGLVYLETAATKNAIIGFKGEGVWGVFEEEQEMLFCEDYIQFEAQLHRLVDDKNLRTSLAQNAFEKAKTMKWDKVRIKYEQIYFKDK